MYKEVMSTISLSYLCILKSMVYFYLFCLTLQEWSSRIAREGECKT